MCKPTWNHNSFSHLSDEQLGQRYREERELPHAMAEELKRRGYTITQDGRPTIFAATANVRIFKPCIKEV